MNSTVNNYISTLPINDSTKWFLSVLLSLNKKTFRPIWIEKNTEFSGRITRHHLYQLYDCGVISRRRKGGGTIYFFTDLRLIYHVASAKKSANYHLNEEVKA